MRRLICLLLTACSVNAYAASDWVQGWFDNAVYDRPSSYKSQKRGYYSAGGFSARVNTSTDYPISVTPPRLSVGCGGIDAFMGGIAFLDADYLVDKTQAIMQAAPYVALDMAMKTMCKECADTLAKAEQIANFLNGIQLNECQMAKPLVTAAIDQDPNALKGLWTEMTGTKDLEEARTRMWGESTDQVKANNGEPTTDLTSLVDGCPADFRDLFQSGSIVQRMADKVGMGNYASTIRGYIGDVNIVAGSVPQAEKVLRCAENDDVSVDDMLYGKSFIKTTTADTACTRSPNTGGVYEIVRTKLSSIANRLKDGSAIPAQEELFIYATPNLPVYSMLMQAMMENNTEEMVEILTQLVSLNYTYMIFNDLYRNTLYSLIRIEKAASTTGNDPSNTKKCRTDLYLDAISKFKELTESASKNREVLQDKYSAKLTEIQNNLNFSETMRQKEERYRKIKASGGVK